MLLWLACTPSSVDGIELIEPRNQPGLIRSMDEITVQTGDRVRVEGWIDGELAAIGHGPEDAEAVLFAQVARVAWLDDLEASRTLGAAVAIGDGRFLYAGGASRGDSAQGETSITAFDLFDGSPLDSEHAGGLPLGDAEHGGRIGLTASVADDRILFAGGAPDLGEGDEQALATTVVWEDGEVRAGPPMTVGRTHAVAHGRVLVGGRTVGAGEMAFRASAEALQGGAFAEVGETERVFGHAATGLDGDTLVCGGAAFNSQGLWTPTAGCDRIDQGVEIVDGLPEAHAFGAMADLGDAVLWTGGTAVEANGQWDLVAASDAAFLYQDGAWTELPSMQAPRAQHVVAPLGDGRALVVGGVSALQLEFLSDEVIPYACAELFDGEGFEALDDCDELVASLSEPAAFPRAATEPGVGTILVGGTRLHAAAARQVAFVPWSGE